MDVLLQIYSQWRMNVCLCQHQVTLPRHVLQSQVALPGELILKRICPLIPGLAGTLRNGSGHCAAQCDTKLEGHNRLVLSLTLHAMKFLQFPPSGGDKPHYFDPLALRRRPELGACRLVSSVLIFKSPFRKKSSGRFLISRLVGHCPSSLSIAVINTTT